MRQYQSRSGRLLSTVAWIAIRASDLFRRSWPTTAVSVGVMLLAIFFLANVMRFRSLFGFGGYGLGKVQAAIVTNFAAFDAPGAGTGSVQGTLGISIDAEGDIAGTYLDQDFVAHGYLRTASGIITTFDAPDAGTTSTMGPGGSATYLQGTIPLAINASATLVGTVLDSNSCNHGFIRTSAGIITEFDAPGGTTTASNCFGYDKVGTIPLAINSAGVVTGPFRDANSSFHGFVRAADGSMTTFDVPGAGTFTTSGTVPLALDSQGNIVGTYLASDSATGTDMYHGFLRTAAGVITTFDPPGAASPSSADVWAKYIGTFATCLNDSGMVAGTYSDANGIRHGFLRLPDGSFSSFDAPGAGTMTLLESNFLQGTGGVSMDASGNIVGLYVDSNTSYHGFIRTTTGAITSIDVPGAGANMIEGTGAFSINSLGQIAGTYADPSFVFHGFLVNAPGLAVTAAPVFSLAGGTYHTPQTLILSDTTPGAVIHYTYSALGVTPTSSSTIYTGPITVNATGTIESIAFAPGYSPSSVSSKSYVYVPEPPATAPVFSLASGTYHSPQSLTLSDSTPGATIYYTTNGTSPTTSSTKYTGPITIASTELVAATAIATGFTLSPVSSKAYTYVPFPTAAAPVFSLPGGTYSTPQLLTLTDTTPGATIYYTTNGTAPTTSSATYTAPLTIASTELVAAAAVAAGYNPSPISSKAYTYSALPQATAPVFSLAGGTYSTPQLLTLNDATPGAVIYFTTNGTTPTASSTKYTGPITISTTELVEAIAVATGYNNSKVSAKAYTIP